MKTIYFVRHGETESNALQVHGHHTDALSERGQRQATLVAKRLIEAEIEIVVSSPYVRARQTAEIINGVLDKRLIYENIFEEVKGGFRVEGSVGRGSGGETNPAPTKRTYA